MASSIGSNRCSGSKYAWDIYKYMYIIKYIPAESYKKTVVGHFPEKENVDSGNVLSGKKNSEKNH